MRRHPETYPGAVCPALGPGLGGVAALRDVIESGQRGRDVFDKRQLGVRVANAQYPAHRHPADNHPVHIASGALHADVVQGREALASEEVDTGEIEDKLLGDAGVALDEAAERVAVRGVDVTPDADEYARCSQALRYEDGAAAPLCFIGGRQLRGVLAIGTVNPLPDEY